MPERLWLAMSLRRSADGKHAALVVTRSVIPPPHYELRPITAFLSGVIRMSLLAF